VQITINQKIVKTLQSNFKIILLNAHWDICVEMKVIESEIKIQKLEKLQMCNIFENIILKVLKIK